MDQGKENCVEMLINDWWADINCGNQCPEFYSWLDSGGELDKVRKYNRFLIQAFRDISRKWFQEFIQIPNIDIPCDGDLRYKVTTFMTSCGTYCVTQYPIFDPSIERYVEYKSCSNTYCCRITEIFCENEDGSVNQEEEVDKTGNIDCSQISFPIGQCEPGQNIYVFPCIDPCED